MNKNSLWKTISAVAAAIALGLLEAAWTTPAAPGATRPMLGCFSIAVVLVFLCWPRLWWVPGLSMVEEIIQIFFGQLPPVRPSIQEALFTHWSASFTMINLYPYITFPMVGIIGEAIYQYYQYRKSERQ